MAPQLQTAQELKKKRHQKYLNKVAATRVPGASPTSFHYSVRQACLTDVSMIALGRAQHENMVLLLHWKLKTEGPKAFSEYVASLSGE